MFEAIIIRRGRKAAGVTNRGYNPGMEFDPIPDPKSSHDSDHRLTHAKTDPLQTPDTGPTDYGEPADPREPPDGADGPPQSGWRKHRFFIAYPLIIILLAAITGIVVAASIRRPQVDSLDDFVPRLITTLYDQRGSSVATYSRENRFLLQEGEVPKILEQAITAVEDANFRSHGGVDLKGILRAVVTNVRHGSVKEGASTITMQLARDLFALSRQQSFKRKIEEAFLAVELEKKFSKQQIITMYCNMVNLSQGNYGMEAAARNYFGKSVQDLSVAEAATLAGIPQRPTHHNPYARPEAVQERRDVVLGRMLAEGFIDQETHDQAVAEPLLVIEPNKEKTLGPYFSEEVRRYLIKTYGETELYDRGLQVHTTLDRDIQRAAEKALHDELLRLEHSRGWRGAIDHVEADDLESHQLANWRGLPKDTQNLIPGEWFQGLVLESDAKKAVVKVADQRFELLPSGFKWTRRREPSTLLKRGDVAWFRLDLPADQETPVLQLEQEPQVQAAALVLESATGAVRAMVGGWSYENNEFNRITQAQRQAGSVYKPFVFGAALEIGFTAADSLFDGPVALPGADNHDSYSPRNFYRRYDGIMTLRHALEHSVNVPAVKLLDMVGVEQVIDFTQRCGITSDLPPYPSLALGAADLIPMEVAAAYATFVNQGVYVAPYLIERIESRNGRTIEEHEPKAHKAMSPGVAYVLTNMLRGVTTQGTGARLASVGIATGGKTGTTNAFTDAWFVGFTPRYTLLTWVGYDKKRSLGRGWTGAHAALPIWEAMVRQGLEDGWLSPDETFDTPPGIVEVQVESTTGLLVGPGAEQTHSEVFIQGTEPVQRFDHEWARIIRLPWYLQEPFYLPKEGERMPGQVADWSPIVEGWGNKGGRR